MAGKGTSDSVISVACSSDGRLVVCGGEEGELLWWDAWTFSLVRFLSFKISIVFLFLIFFSFRVEKTPHSGAIGSIVLDEVQVAGKYGVKAWTAGRDGGGVVSWEMSSNDLKEKKRHKTK